MKRINYLLLSAVILCFSCKSGSTSGEKAPESNQNPIVKFTLPEIPAMYTTPEQRADFLVKHYWDHFNFTDTNYIRKPEIAEQAWADFLDISNHVPLETARKGMDILMVNAAKDTAAYNYFVSLADKYLYDPNSPFRNEELYIIVLESQIASTHLSDIEKTRPKYRLELALKNRVGTKALNFVYTLKSGKQGSLHNLSADYILLYINNPGCHACGEITQGLKSSMRIQYLLEEKRMIILCIYPDEELDEWEKYQNDFPAEWINGYDKGTVIRDKNLYDLKAIPSLYLLDRNKTVILKDATLQQVEEYLRTRD